MGNVGDFTLAEIKQLKMRDRDGRPTEYEVLTLEEALELARGKILVNIDKFAKHPKEILDVVAAVGSLKEVIVKSSQQPDEARKSFGPYWKQVENGELLYMPIISYCMRRHDKTVSDFPLELADGARKVSMYEICADVPEHIAAFGAGILAKRAPRIWVNTISDRLSANHSDRRALLDPDGNWGWVIEQGVTMIQTDYAAELIVYLTSKGRRELKNEGVRK